ncbi:bis(5'-nucleosyl)-tetraphosphatase (symmetrical) YqeK [bacterium]|nr:bis(5'-nucleosyl)-tetraphosphatase (symmetrical) YqeK [bacterium]MBQ9149418.1 bis(5'-nucleosyl)-tetraphosphatase (symmetrical) YqeK [bacterium]
MKTIDYIQAWLEENLSAKRYSHSLGCAQTAKELAKLFNQDEEKAYLAGLVHDCAKNFDDSELLNLITNVIKTGYEQSELKNPKTYHAIVGAYLIQKEFEIYDEEIISAVRNHTIGKVNMSIFDKIVFLADKIEPNSRDEKYTKKVWKLIEKNKGVIGLDLALLRCFCETIKSLIRRKYYICLNTIDVYNELQQQVGELLDDE